MPRAPGMMVRAATVLMAVGSAGAVERVEAPATGVGMKGAETDLKVPDDVKIGSLRLSRIDYGTSDQLGRAWLVLHYEDTTPCEEGEIRCGTDTHVQVNEPMVFVHVAWTSQFAVPAVHSSMSAQLVPLPWTSE